MRNLRGKRVTLMGLGLLGGGVATAKWLVRQGAQLTVTDARSAKKLAKSLAALGTDQKKITFVLGKHRRADFIRADLVVANQAVPHDNQYLTLARKHGIPVEADLGLFLAACRNPVVAVTGTRGKTTTTAWIAHFLGTKPAGNSSDTSLLKLLGKLKKNNAAVVELSSFQLEYAEHLNRAPDIAVITNLYRDHLNRHGTIARYAGTKANIFRAQTKNQHLILNADDAWTPFFLKQKPNGAVWFTSLKPLPKNRNGLFIKKGGVIFQNAGASRALRCSIAPFRERWGEHGLRNLIASMLAAHLAGAPWTKMIRLIPSLPSIPYRQEIVFKKKNLIIVNDSAGTSPEATIAALERFKKQEIILIAGGTDKNLSYAGAWARMIRKYVKPKNLHLLEGSATDKMLGALGPGYIKKMSPKTYPTLEAIVDAMLCHSIRGVILFSPGAASFEKFKNEFDRGEKFNLYLRQLHS